MEVIEQNSENNWIVLHNSNEINVELKNYTLLVCNEVQVILIFPRQIACLIKFITIVFSQ